MSGVLDRLEGLVREVREYRSDYDVTAAIDSLSSAMIELLPVLREFAEAEGAFQDGMGGTRRADKASAALLAALRTAPAGEAT